MAGSLSILHVVVFLLAVRNVIAFDREICLKSALDLLSNHTLSPNHPFFYRDTPDSPPYVDAKNLTLTLAGCKAICGPEQTWYSDVGPRLGTWLIPVILLLINVEVSPLGKRSLLELLHLLGDPIDSLWSLLHKVDSWDRCYAEAEQHPSLCLSCRRVVATVFAGHQEMQGSETTSEDRNLDTLISRYNLVDHLHEWRSAAVNLADSRTDDMVRTLLALVLFLYQLVSNFVPTVGGVPSSPPGSRIATSVLLSCFIPAILLTNAVGGFVSRRSACSTMANLAATTGGQPLRFADQHSFFLSTIPYLARESVSDYYNALPWSGGIYMYRPWKSYRVAWGRGSVLYNFSCGLLAATPVLIGFVAGSVFLWWQTPRGFNCRHIWLISVSLLWITSAIITWMTLNPKLATGKYHWHFILIKDACVAIPSFIMFFLSASGLFNSCWCWSGPWEYPGKGRVMVPVSFYESDGTVMWPVTLSVAFLLQFLVIVFIVFYWRQGFRLLRWSEKSRQQEYDRVLNDTIPCRCMAKELDGEDDKLSGNSNTVRHK